MQTDGRFREVSAHVAVLSNPAAGKGRAIRIAAEAIDRLRASGLEVRAFSGASAIEARELTAHALAAGPAAFVVVGGDGTLSGILDLICDQSVPVAFVPAGTGNDLARALGLPLRSAADAALVAMSGRHRVIDVGEIRSGGDTRLFLTVAALGFDARVTERTDRLRWPSGPLRYYLALVIELVRLRPVPFRLSLDGGPVRDAAGTLIAVGNTESYGGGMPICAGATPDDGMLDVVHVRALSRLRLVALFPRLLRGRHLSTSEVSHRRVRSVSISAPGLTVYADGERVAAGECTIGVRVACLTMLVPGTDDAV